MARNGIDDVSESGAFIRTASTFRNFVSRDPLYAVHFKCNRKLIREYPNLFSYIKDIYQIPGMSNTVKMDHIKKQYCGSHPSLNPSGIVPCGPNVDYSSPHDRKRFSP